MEPSESEARVGVTAACWFLLLSRYGGFSGLVQWPSMFSRSVPIATLIVAKFLAGIFLCGLYASSCFSTILCSCILYGKPKVLSVGAFRIGSDFFGQVQ